MASQRPQLVRAMKGDESMILVLLKISRTNLEDFLCFKSHFKREIYLYSSRI
jgi:hypothetical protein